MTCRTCGAAWAGPGDRCATCAGSRADAAATRHGGTDSPAPARAAGSDFGRFRLLESLGSGAMGTVWKAWDPELGRVVALKRLREDGPGGPDATARFLREARLAAALRHPHIARVHDLGVLDGQPWLAMECLDGGTLAERLLATRDLRTAATPEGRKELAEAVEILAHVADAVAHAHAAGVIHRDLKPANVQIDGTGRPYVMDFGLARRVDRPEAGPRLTVSGQVLGTPAYMSPEQAEADTGRIGPASDVWALGVILFEILTGELPYAAEGSWQMFAALSQKEVRRPRDLAPGAPPELEAVCLRALERDPARRYASAAEFAEELGRWQRGEAVRAPRPGPARRLARWITPARVAAFALLVLVPLAAALAVRWTRDRERAARADLLLEVAGAVSAFEDEIRRTPVPPETRTDLARQPLGLLDRLIESDPEAGTPYAWRGRLRALLGDDAGACADLDRACALAPGDAAAWTLRGLHRVDRYARGCALPQVTVGPLGVQFSAVPEDSAGQRVLREQGLADLARAEGLPTSGPGLGEDTRRMARALASLYGGRTGGWDEAIALVQGIDHPRADRTRGLALYCLRRFAESVASLEQACRAWPADAEARTLLGRARTQLAIVSGWKGGDSRPVLRQAIDDLAEASRLAPSADAVQARALAFLLLGYAEEDRHGDGREHHRSAAALYDRVLEADPSATWALRGRAGALDALGREELSRHGDAREILRRSIADQSEVIRREPGNALDLANRGLARKRLADALERAREDPRPETEAALSDFAETLRLDPGNAVTYQNRAALWLREAQRQDQRGEDARATYGRVVEDCDRMLALAANSPRVLYMRGAARFRLGGLEAAHGDAPGETWRLAEQDLKRARPLSECLPLLAQLYHAWGRIEEAIATWDEWGRTSPGDVQRAITAMDRLRTGADAPRWRALLGRATAALQQGEWALARSAYRESLALFAALPLTLREKALEDPQTRLALPAAWYNLACVESLLSTGCARREEEPQAISDADRRALVDLAFAHLDEACRAGFDDLGHLQGDPDLAPLQADPRWEALERRMGKRD